MKNKISDLRLHIFAAMERLSDESLNKEDLKKEIERSTALATLGNVLIESVKAETGYAKITGRRLPDASKFLELDPSNILEGNPSLV